MSRMTLLLLVCFFSSVLLASASAKRPVEAWSYYHFNGTAFTAGPAADGSAFVAVHEKARPVILTAKTAPMVQTVLAEGTGAIAGICYLHSSGGKSGGTGGFVPYPHIQLLITPMGGQPVTVQTDDNGYFVVVLAAGKYSIGSGPATAEVTVERGTTTLVPLRAGKRMVD